MRKLAIILWLTLISAGIASLFWFHDLKYKLPTPVPANYHPVPQGESIALPDSFYSDTQKPVFLHFFNPDCPCSRFNMQHFKSLVNQFGDKVQFRIVVMSNDRYNEKQVQEKFGIHVPVSFDPSLPKICGVYSTPQAALITADHHLYYRGNYNKSRYCTDNKTNYAEIALNGLTHHLPFQHFDQFAVVSYGCELPKIQNN